MFGRRSATTSNDVGSKLLYKTAHCGRKILCAQRIFGSTFDQNRQSCIGDYGKWAIPMFGNVRKMRRHFRRSCCTVQSKRSNWKWSQGIDHSADIRPQEHRARGLHRDGNKNRHIANSFSSRFERFQTCGHRTFNLQEVLACFDHEAIRAAINQTARLFSIGIRHHRPRCLTERYKFRSRSHRSSDKSRSARFGIFCACSASDLRRFDIQVIHPTNHFFIKVCRDKFVGSECVSLYNISTRSKKTFVDTLNDVWSRSHQYISAIIATDVIRRSAIGACVNGCSHRSVEDERSQIELTEKSWSHETRISAISLKRHHSSG